MEGLKLVQSLPICCSLAAIGGAMEVAATAITAIPAVREKQGIVMPKSMQLLTIAGNVTLQGIGSLVGHLVATWFGPVALVVPFFFSATLLCNMLIVGILGEQFSKNMRVGTLVIVVSVVLLPVVGPSPQEDQDIGELMSHWYSRTWFAILAILSFGTGILLPMGITQYSQKLRMMILLVGRASSICLNLTVSRSFILGPSGLGLIVLIIIKLISGSIYTTAIVVQSFAVEQSKFVPLNATLIILVNAITGIIIWEDWRVVQSWYGYVCVFVLLGLGCDLLLSVPLLSSENPEFGINRRLSMIPAVEKRVSTLMLQSHLDPFLECDYDEDDEDPLYEEEEGDGREREDIEEQEKVQDGREKSNEAEQPANETPISKTQRRISRVDAWKQIIGPIPTRRTNNSIVSSVDNSSVLQSNSSSGFQSSFTNQILTSSTEVGSGALKMGKHVLETTKLLGRKDAAGSEYSGTETPRLDAWRSLVPSMKGTKKKTKHVNISHGTPSGK